MINATPAQKAQELYDEHDGSYDAIIAYIELTREDMQDDPFVPTGYVNHILDELITEVKKLFDKS